MCNLNFIHAFQLTLPNLHALAPPSAAPQTTCHVPNAKGTNWQKLPPRDLLCVSESNGWTNSSVLGKQGRRICRTNRSRRTRRSQWEVGGGALPDEALGDEGLRAVLQGEEREAERYLTPAWRRRGRRTGGRGAHWPPPVRLRRARSLPIQASRMRPGPGAPRNFFFLPWPKTEPALLPFLPRRLSPVFGTIRLVKAGNKRVPDCLPAKSLPRLGQFACARGAQILFWKNRPALNTKF